MKKNHVGIVGTGIYLPKYRMTAAEISESTNGVWTEQAVIEKLGILEKIIPGPNDGTQEMGVYAALDALNNTKTKPEEIDVILSIGEEWKEYPLTTTGIYIQEQIGAINAWAIDLQQRCGTTVSAMKIAQDMLMNDDSLNTALIVGGYRNVDFIDYTNSATSFMFNLSAGGGAIILKKNYGKNILLGTHIITDGSLSRNVRIEYGGSEKPINSQNIEKAYSSLNVFDEPYMKARLNEISMKNWMTCIDKAFEKSGIAKKELSFLCGLHFKRSMYAYILETLGLTFNDTIYLENYGHMGQVDQILILHLAQERQLLKKDSIISMIAAGIGYAWNANVIKWG
ncbi:MAG: 3-oxoacyl-ACP synthase [Salinivirgaceae bacterium]|nr:3-oxoacyl-ACP synthase [Salinivirgaceae bacterium]